MENKFYNLAIASGRFSVLNSTIPTCSSISEYDEAMLEEFIANTQLLVNTLGYKVFDAISELEINENNDEVFHIIAARGANAKGVVVSGGFAVLKNSVIANSVTQSMSDHLISKRDYLLQNRIVDDSFTFTKNYVFTSPSLAAAMVMGRNANGLLEWKNDNNTPLKNL